MTSFTIDRKQASEIIGVSLRTLDRYIRGGELNARKINGFVKLDENQVKGFKTGYTPRPQAPQEDTEIVQEGVPRIRIHRSLNNFDRVEAIDVHSEVERVLGEEISSSGRQTDIYEVLYKETRDELKEYQKKLEIANYQVGHLEAQVKNSIPLLAYRAESLKLANRENTLKKVVQDQVNKAKGLERILDLEKTNAKIYAALLFGVLLLQPILWWVLRR
ncbi:MAG: hypothetical protein WCT46_01760 [Candidatus Gracilibacteria bacterium]|jgi:hypothetical protein